MPAFLQCKQMGKLQLKCRVVTQVGVIWSNYLERRMTDGQGGAFMWVLSTDSFDESYNILKKNGLQDESDQIFNKVKKNAFLHLQM